MELLILLAIISAYLLPCVIARGRRHRSTNSIAICNLFFGWTIIGWILCLSWGLSGNVE